MFFRTITTRQWYLAATVACAVLLGFALYKQHQDYLDPCPLCIIQRLAFMWIGAWALLGALHNPARVGQRIYSGLILLGAAFGAAVAGRHVWMQSLPPDQVPECGPGLNYMLENFPLAEVARSLFFGSGSCAEVDWTLLGLSMPGWTLLWYLVLGAGTLYFTWRKA
jgi:disulfide bond formation protein DsbB